MTGRFNLYLFVLTFGIVSLEVDAAEFRVERVSIQEGVFIDDMAKGGYTFKMEGKSRFYDFYSAKAWLGNLRPGISDLEKIGFLLTTGKIIYGGPGDLEKSTLEELRKEPKSTVASTLFAGMTGQIVALKTGRPTRAVCLDISMILPQPVGTGGPLAIPSMLSLVLWQNLDGKDRIEERSSHRSVDASILTSFEIYQGTLEQFSEVDRSYKWRLESGKEETFYVSAYGPGLDGGGEGPLGIPNLRKVGVKLDDGREFLYQSPVGTRSEVALKKVMQVEDPGHKVTAHLFQGEGDSRVEIAAQGTTLVFRAILRMGGRTVTLWANRKPPPVGGD